MKFSKVSRITAVFLAALLCVGSGVELRAASDPSYQANVYLTPGGAALQIKAAAGPGILSDNGSVVFNQRFRTSIANVNTGVTLLPAIAGYKYRLIDGYMVPVGGAVITCTAVVILGTQAAGSATLLSAAVAALTQSARVGPGYTNVANVSGLASIIADGASFVQNDVNTAITIGKTGGTCATATNVDTVLTYAIEP
jgi:hypothetical protein